MPKKLDDLAFLKNQLRWFIAAKGNRYAPTPGCRLRAMLLLGALSGLLDVTFKDQETTDRETPEAPSTPAIDSSVEAMLKQAEKNIRGGVNGAGIPKS